MISSLLYSVWGVCAPHPLPLAGSRCELCTAWTWGSGLELPPNSINCHLQCILVSSTYFYEEIKKHHRGLFAFCYNCSSSYHFDKVVALLHPLYGSLTMSLFITITFLLQPCSDRADGRGKAAQSWDFWPHSHEHRSRGFIVGGSHQKPPFFT